MIRHSVLFAFNEDITGIELKRIEAEFSKLKSVISEIKDMEWGLNNSPEGKTKGFTHMFFLTFNDLRSRDAYLVHPEHKAFSEMAGPFVKDVLVFDYKI